MTFSQNLASQNVLAVFFTMKLSAEIVISVVGVILTAISLPLMWDKVKKSRRNEHEASYSNIGHVDFQHLPGHSGCTNVQSSGEMTINSSRLWRADLL